MATFTTCGRDPTCVHPTWCGRFVLNKLSQCRTLEQSTAARFVYNRSPSLSSALARIASGWCNGRLPADARKPVRGGLGLIEAITEAAAPPRC